MRYEFWIDRGGTFTDCIGYDRETGELRVTKVLSSDRAPIDGIRKLLDLSPNASIPPARVRLGTTLATNALLERRGVPCALLVTRGFGDLLEIGDQTRPELFRLRIEKPRPLPAATLEIDARSDAAGAPLVRPDLDAVREELVLLRAQGIASVAIVVMNDHERGLLERDVRRAASDAGFRNVSLSSEIAPELGLLSRAHTTVLDAYLTPLLGERLAALEAELPGSELRLMQSSGVLTEAAKFRGPNAVLSGPVGGAVAAARVAEREGFGAVVAFDMGGTSTDVSRFAGRLERVWETEVAGVRVRAPALPVTTVAAGGGSLCRVDGARLTVGPESAGADPGPLCYGNPRASELTLTDVNLLLGRISAEHFPFPLDRERPRRALEAMVAQLRAGGHAYEPDELAGAFLEIANQAMAEAVRQVSIARGHDVRSHTLLVLGGAGGQHACALAARLGMAEVALHPLAGVLSAYGIGLSDVGFLGVREAHGRALDDGALAELERAFAELEREGRAALDVERELGSSLRVFRSVELCYRGAETTITLELDTAAALAGAFHERHEREFGYARREHALELVAARVEVTAARADEPALKRPDAPVARASAPPVTRLHAGGKWYDDVPVYAGVELPRGVALPGPLLVAEPTGTFVVDPDFELIARDSGVLVARRRAGVAPADIARGRGVAPERADPLLLEVTGHRFMSIAEQMGEILRRTALSTNIRERRDFSCALFDARGDLVANAPHIPVHLGAMSESVRAVLDLHAELRSGDVFAVNDPFLGGSHLPDITVVAPVHDSAGTLRYFTASRGHHADVGGITPGSMPPFSTTLDEEGVAFRGERLVRDGHFDEAAVLAILGSGPYPARNPRDNVADLKAQIAAVRLGASLLHELSAEYGYELVASYMQHVKDDARRRVEAEIEKLGSEPLSFRDSLDDGTPIVVSLHARDGRLLVDFTGTGPEQKTNLNAPRAVTVAAVLYFLRVLIDRTIPLNAGCLVPVDLEIPHGSLLSPGPTAAVAAGNVETSQRVVDVLLAAAGRAAASQGTMNNFTFGNDTFGYYETICGGAGAGSEFHGASAVHTHMTNTRITDPEVLERRFPIRLLEFSVRRHSGGAGRFRGGDGICREFQFLAPLSVSLISQRRTTSPFGLAGGHPGTPGRNLLNDTPLPGNIAITVTPGDRLRIETPGGGGYGLP
jgi:5-oxoprolinase (ATP-hydrolysing)